MTHALVFPVRMDQPVYYRVWVQGIISERWRDWFDAMEIHPAQAEVTCLSGVIQDQAALIGVLQRLYSLGYPILRVEAASQSLNGLR